MSDCQKTQRIKKNLYPITPKTLPVKGSKEADKKSK